MGRACNIMAEKRNAYMILEGKSEGKKTTSKTKT
jgi:hypothetical protein